MTLPIATPNLLLRAFRETDLDAFLAYRNDPEVARFQYWEGISPAEASAFLRRNEASTLGAAGEWQQIAIALSPGEELIGDLGVFLRTDGRSAELGFTLAREHQGRGLAREALAGLVDELFRRPGLESLEAVADTRNVPAIALLKRLGYQTRSTAKAVFKGEPCEEHTLSLSRETWLGNL